MRVLFQDIGYALRSLRRTQAFACIVIVTLAFGIAANTVVFTLINAAVLRPLPYPNPGQLTVLSWYGSKGLLSNDISASAFLKLREQARSLQGVAAVHNVDMGVNVVAAGKSQYANALHVSDDFFRTLGVLPSLGRTFAPEEEQPGGPHSAILSYALWARDFDKSLSTIGRDVRINGEQYTVVGIMPAEFRSFPDADLWLPLQLDVTAAAPGNDYRVIARLRDTVTLQDAQHELSSSNQYKETYPLLAHVGEARLVISGLQPFIASGIQRSLTLLFGAVVFVLLITCTSLAVLLTVRASARNQEVGIRLALGSSRGRLIRIFLLESLIIAGLGGIFGLILAKEAIPLVLWLAPINFPSVTNIQIDLRVLLFTLIVSVFTAFLFGLIPALNMSRGNLTELLGQSSKTATSNARQTRMARVLVLTQSALTFILLAGAGLLLRSFLNLQTVPLGFNFDNLWVAQVSLAAHRYDTTAASSRLLQRLGTQIQNFSGVDSTASTSGLPLEKGMNLVIFPSEKPENNIYTEYRIVSSDYFRVMRIAVIAGRSFSTLDHAQANPSAIINESLAKRLWPEQSALGRYIAIGSTLGGVFSDSPRQIIGVVADTRDAGLSQAPSPTLFVPLDQASDRITEFANHTLLTSIIIRTSNRANLSTQLRNTMELADSDLSLASLRPFDQVISTSLAEPRFYTVLISAFGLFTVLLTGIALYGLLSYRLVLRTREIGIRIALGARRPGVVGLILKEGFVLVAIGVILGLVAAAFETKVFGTMLYNVGDSAFGVLVIAAAVLGAVAILASLLTATRVLSIEPIVALRTE
jgi:putative ABC transport system permease protein